ncbi:PqqD family protein [Clostridium ihumii]|uniref:PqqD family protein n=1 Tax=Clostridium ihumii TaxID=1470356 RepID=UPI00059076EC|nr:PqqD family protein [Clostridium ihumii]
MKKTKNDNILEKVPFRNEKINWDDSGESIVLIIKRDSFAEKIMHKIFKKPEVIKIELEKIGSTVWRLCDGHNNVYEISEKLKESHGEDIEPALPRLIEYIKILINNGYISLK